MPVQVSVKITSLRANKDKLSMRGSCLSSKSDSLSITHVTKFNESENNLLKDNKKDDEKKLRKNFFPHKLMEVVTSPLFKDCIAWDHEGKSFTITDMEKFATRSNISHRTFRKESFARKLNRWGFRIKKNNGIGYYSHPLFCRDKPWLCNKIRCSESRAKQTTEISSKRHIDESTYKNISNINQSKKRKITVFDDNITEVGHRFDHSERASLIKVLSRYFVDDRLRKYLLLRQLCNKELTQIMY